jgi:MFS family permease
MLIAGRTIQGMGSGGINMINDVIVSDLVPLRERGNYIALILYIYFVGTALGPFIGGVIVDTTSWRWVFYINLPIGGAAMVLIFLFLRVRSRKDKGLFKSLKRIDYMSNLLLIGATVAVLCALPTGGSKYAWSSWHVLVPLVLGLVGLAGFMLFEASSLVTEPVVPPCLFANRTSAVVVFATFLNAALLYWFIFLPVNFQAVLGSSPARPGVQLLPSIIIALPAAIIAVMLLTNFSRYKPIHVAGFGICMIGMGIFSLLDERPSTAEWAIYQMVADGGGGLVLNTLLPACQAGLLESDQAATTAVWSFIRSFGSIWGVAIPAAIFNSRWSQLAGRSDSVSARNALANGHAYEYASTSLLNTFLEGLRTKIVSVYVDSLKSVWRFSIIFSGVPFLLVLLGKQIKLHTELDSEYGWKTTPPKVASWMEKNKLLRMPCD